MGVQERRLRSKICMLEDMLLRSKNSREIEKLMNELTKTRMLLQKIYYEKES